MDHVDVDEDVISICREHFAWGRAWDDPRVRLHIANGVEFVQQAPTSHYDVVIQDSSDPWSWDERGTKKLLPSEVLYAEDHFAAVHRILTLDGIFNLQVKNWNGSLGMHWSVGMTNLCLISCLLVSRVG